MSLVRKLIYKPPKQNKSYREEFLLLHQLKYIGLDQKRYRYNLGENEGAQGDYCTSAVCFCRCRIVLLRSIISASFLYLLKSFPILELKFCKKTFSPSTIKGVRDEEEEEDKEKEQQERNQEDEQNRNVHVQFTRPCLLAELMKEIKQQNSKGI